MKINIKREIELTDEEVVLIVEKATKKEEWEEGDDYYLISSDGEVMEESFNNDSFDRNVIEVGNAFKTQDLAERELERRKIKVRLWKWAKDNAPFEPDWSDDSQIKYLTVWYGDKLRGDHYHEIKHQTELPYFKSSEDVQRFIKENESDLLTYFTK